MNNKLMILPSRDYKMTRLVRIPDDFEEHEAFRYVTGLIAEIEEGNPVYNWDEIADILEDSGFEIIDFILGPALD